MSVSSVRQLALLALAIMVAGTTGHRLARAEDEIDPTGGLRSRGMVPNTAPAAASREELVRKWDLDGNGTIDASEASIARARMRRARTQLELDSGLDPVTGKPRAMVTEAKPDEEATSDDVVPAEPAEARVTTSGTGTTEPRSPTTPPAAGQDPKPSTQRPANQPSRPGSMTGGVRAGAPAASPGYGSRGPKPDLNAGTAKPTKPMVPGARGGLLPSVRPTPPPRGSAPSGPAPRPAPVTADDIGGF